MVIMMKVTFAISNGRQLVFHYKTNIICYVIFLADYTLVFFNNLVEKMHYNQLCILLLKKDNIEKLGL